MHTNNNIARNQIKKQNESTSQILSKRTMSLNGIYSRAPAHRLELLFVGREELVARDRCELFSISIDRLGLCKPLFIAHILPHNASNFSHMHTHHAFA